MQLIPITIYIAALLALLMFILSVTVSMRRVTLGMSQGNMTKYPYQDGGDEQLKRCIRAFGNFTEYTPFAVISLGLLEISGASENLLWGLGLCFFAGRIFHALGMLINPAFAFARMLDMFASYAILLNFAWQVLL